MTLKVYVRCERCQTEDSPQLVEITQQSSQFGVAGRWGYPHGWAMFAGYLFCEDCTARAIALIHKDMGR